MSLSDLLYLVVVEGMLTGSSEVRSFLALLKGMDTNLLSVSPDIR
jgi:hypothetical protein